VHAINLIVILSSIIVRMARLAYCFYFLVADTNCDSVTGIRLFVCARLCRGRALFRIDLAMFVWYIPRVRHSNDVSNTAYLLLTVFVNCCLFVITYYCTFRTVKQDALLDKMADNSSGDPEKLELKMAMGFCGKISERNIVAA